jgi:hypothetical protein
MKTRKLETDSCTFANLPGPRGGPCGGGLTAATKQETSLASQAAHLSTAMELGKIGREDRGLA